MKRVLLVLLATSLISVAFGRQRSDQRDNAAREKRVSSVFQPPSDENRFLFFQMPFGLVENARDVSFIVHDGGTIYLVDRVILDRADDNQQPSIQLLSSQPTLLDELLVLAQQRDRHISISIRANREMIGEFSLKKFLAYNRQLKRDASFHPVHVRSKVDLFNWPRTNPRNQSFEPRDLTCLQQCDQDYAQCALDTCGEATDLCGECLDAWQACRDACPQEDPPCPTSSTRTVEYLLRCFALERSQQCVQNYYEGPYSFFYDFACDYATYTFTHTVYCDGSSSDSADVNYSTRITSFVNSGEPCYP